MSWIDIIRLIIIWLPVILRFLEEFDDAAVAAKTAETVNWFYNGRPKPLKLEALLEQSNEVIAREVRAFVHTLSFVA